MADETPQPPSTVVLSPPPADLELPPADIEPPSAVELTPPLADIEPPLASVELEKDKDTNLPPPAAAAAEVEHHAVTVVEKTSPLTPAPSDAAVLSVEQVSVSTKLEEESKPSSQQLSAALALPQEADPPPETTTTTVKEVTIEAEKPKPIEESIKKAPAPMPSFKEESNKLSDLSDSETKALSELKSLIQEAITNNEFSEEVSIWGIPLTKDDRTDVILLKFLRARDFKPKESFAMLRNTLAWRDKYKVDELINEELGDDLDKVVFMHGYDKEGHPVCYNVYGEFQNKELYNKTFGDEEKRARFLRWRVQFLERSIRKLDFRPGGVNTIFQVSDLKNSPGPAKRELRIATKQALQLLQDNYPEFVAKQVFINVPWWYLAFYTMISPFLTQRTKSKFVFAGPSKTAETLFKYISPEQVPIQYGGLTADPCDCDPEFTVEDLATEIIVKPATKQTVEIIVHEKCILVWELRVLGWEVSYSAEYVPNDESSYTVMIQKRRKMSPTDEPVVSNSFKVAELGKVLLTVNNPTSKKKTMLYRFKVKPFSD